MGQTLNVLQLSKYFMRTIIYTLFLVTILASCNNGIPKDKLTVIENITLGQPSNSYVKQFDSLLIVYSDPS